MGSSETGISSSEYTKKRKGTAAAGEGDSCQAGRERKKEDEKQQREPIPTRSHKQL